MRWHNIFGDTIDNNPSFNGIFKVMRKHKSNFHLDVYCAAIKSDLSEIMVHSFPR